MLGSHGYLFHLCMQLYEVKPLGNADMHFTTYFTSKFTLGDITHLLTIIIAWVLSMNNFILR